MYEKLSALDTIRLNFSDGSLLALNITIGLIMFGVALGIRIEDFKNILKDPRSVLLGVISQFLLLPAITFLFCIALGKYITPTVAIGMILVAACPGGNISNFISSLAKANIALSVSLTAIATLSAVFMTPLNFMIWGELYAANSDLVVPLRIDFFEMLKTVVMLLGIPLALGMFVAYRYKKLTARIIKPIKIFSIVAFSAMVILAFISNYEYFIKYIALIFFIVLIHNFIALSTGFSFARIFKRSLRDQRTISIETGIQNSALALALLFNPKIFPVELEIGGMAFIAAWWGIWHILAGLGIASVWSSKRFQKNIVL